MLCMHKTDRISACMEFISLIKIVNSRIYILELWTFLAGPSSPLSPKVLLGVTGIKM